MKLKSISLRIVAKLVCLPLDFFFTDVEGGVGDEVPPPTQIGHNFHVEQHTNDSLSPNQCSSDDRYSYLPHTPGQLDSWHSSSRWHHLVSGAVVATGKLL
jgi:hypothetical protein